MTFSDKLVLLSDVFYKINCKPGAEGKLYFHYAEA